MTYIATFILHERICIVTRDKAVQQLSNALFDILTLEGDRENMHRTPLLISLRYLATNGKVEIEEPNDSIWHGSCHAAAESVSVLFPLHEIWFEELETRRRGHGVPNATFVIFRKA